MAKSRFSDDDELKDATADIVARGQRVRERVRELMVSVLKGERLAPGAAQTVVHEVMGGAIEALEDAVPATRAGTLRQVMTGLGDAFAVVGASSRRAAESVAQHGRDLQEDVPVLQRATSDASRQVLSAMSRFSRRLSGSVRDEIETMVAEARRTGLDLAPVAKRTAKAAASDPVGLASETMHAGMRLAGSTAAQLMSATGGMLSGFGEAVAAVSGQAASEGKSRSKSKSGGKKKAGASSKSSAPKSDKASGQRSSQKSSKKSGQKSGGGGRTTSGKASSKKAASKKTSGKKTSATKSSATRSSAKKSAAKTTAVKKSAAKKSGARKSGAKSTTGSSRKRSAAGKGSARSGSRKR